ncbi:hypothetical protein HAX54_051893 [Datura stramonium]|uniref:Uncharacterized protein n=1 Tax=Datura stramonium TaxID=4076 RepID=A0ABS8SYW1_DATST|nr:hypothetical protein [Datura stramonium]
MEAAQLTNMAMYNGLTEFEVKEEISKICSSRYSHCHCYSFSRISQNSLKYVYCSNNCSLSMGKSKRFLSSPDTTAATGIDDLSSSSGEVVELNETVPL